MEYKYFEEYKKANKDFNTDVGYMRWLENQLKAEREKYKKLEAAYDSLSNSNDLN